MDTVLVVNATIGFSENLFLVLLLLRPKPISRPSPFCSKLKAIICNVYINSPVIFFNFRQPMDMDVLIKKLLKMLRPFKFVNVYMY